VARKKARSWEFMRVSSLLEISFYNSEISSFAAQAVFMQVMRMHAAIIASRYFVTHLIDHNTLFKNHIDDYE
jgi:hypothetical protein